LQTERQTRNFQSVSAVILQEMAQLDRLDRQLLAQLQDDASLTNEALAERVGLSPSAVHRRVRRLQVAGVIERQVAIVDPAAAGHPASFLVSVEVERERPDLVRKLRDWFRGEPAVQQAYYVTGSADYVLLVVTRDIQAFDALMSEMMASNPNVRRFTTNVVMSAVKRGLMVPIDES
jgi:DNA-binding Lrp family transcriptional regulator